LKGQRQTSAEYRAETLRSAVKNHAAYLGGAVSRLRLNARRIDDLVAMQPDGDPELQSCLDLLHIDIDRIFDTMVRVRWAALGLRPDIDLTDNHISVSFSKEPGFVSETKPMIYIVDDNPSVRKALSRLFRSMDYDAEAFPSAKQFLEDIPSGHPACVVLDVRMPRMSGLDLQVELAKLGSDLPIVFITGHGDIDMAVQAMKDGAVDFLPKPFDDQDLIDSVERALQLHRDLRVFGQARHEVEERLDRLTPREREVFEHVVKGMLNKQIAYDLGTSEKTIKVHRGRVMQKMEAESLADLVRMAGRVGIEGPSTAD